MFIRVCVLINGDCFVLVMFGCSVVHVVWLLPFVGLYVCFVFVVFVVVCWFVMCCDCCSCFLVSFGYSCVCLVCLVIVCVVVGSCLLVFVRVCLWLEFFVCVRCLWLFVFVCVCPCLFVLVCDDVFGDGVCFVFASACSGLDVFCLFPFVGACLFFVAFDGRLFVLVILFVIV